MSDGRAGKRILGAKSAIAAAVLWVVGGALLLPAFLPVLSPDGTSYVSIGLKYFRGDWAHAVNGYWGPLLSWLIVPFLALRLDPYVAARIVILLAGFPLLWAVRRLNESLELGKPLSAVVLFACVPVGLFMAAAMVTPDLLVAAILLAYLAVFMDHGFPRRWTSGLWCGVLGALAFFAKPYALPFFLVHFSGGILFRWIRQPVGERRRFFTAGLAGLTVFFVLSGAWIGLISAKYHHFVINSASRYNLAYLRPESGGHPVHNMGFVPPPNGTAFSAWEDPSLLPLPSWNPMRSAEDRAHYVRRLKRNFADVITAVKDFSPLAPAILIVGLAFIAVHRFASRRGTLIAGLFLTLIVYTLGYMLILVEDRYLWLDAFLLLFMGAGLAAAAFSGLKSRAWIGAAAGLALIVSFAVTPAKFFPQAKSISASDSRIPAAVIRRLALQLKSDYGLHGSFAATDYWSDSVIIAAWDHLQFYGVMRPEWSGPELEAELKKHQVRYFFQWGHTDPKFDFLKDYIKVASFQGPRLDIYAMKKRPRAEHPPDAPPPKKIGIGSW